MYGILRNKNMHFKNEWITLYIEYTLKGEVYFKNRSLKKK